MIYTWLAGKVGWLAVIGALLAALMFMQVRVSNARAGADRARAELATTKAKYAQDAQAAEARYRADERRWQDHATQIGAQKDDQIRTIGGKLDVALASLRNRPGRAPSGAVPPPPGTCPAATGAELSGPDAEFLARESARADAVVAERDFCYARYRDLLQPATGR